MAQYYNFYRSVCSVAADIFAWLVAEHLYLDKDAEHDGYKLRAYAKAIQTISKLDYDIQSPHQVDKVWSSSVLEC